ncbi:MAG: hypothetical protein V4651_08505, partial [Bacteroidota bacterium]
KCERQPSNIAADWQIPEGQRPENGWSGICHLHVTNGQIIYCSDCTHELSGKTIPMVDLK